MKINFTHIFQDSWNFMRNQRSLVISFAVFFFLLTFTTQTILNAILPNIITQLSTPPHQATTDIPEDFRQMASLMTNSHVLLISLVSQIINSLLSTWGLVSIHYISQQKQLVLGKTFVIAIKYFVGVLLLSVLVIFPLLYGVINLLTGAFLGLVLVAIGLYLFLRLCLSPLVYLFENKSFFSAIQFCWQQTNKRLSSLLVYCLVVYVLLSILSNQLLALDQNILLQIITTALSSFITIFSLVFSYRFYHLFFHQN